jgi:hypothetical protein
MYRENLALKSGKFIFTELFIDVGMFPIWWYTTGLKKAFFRMLNTVAQGNQELGLSVWLKNIFKPMYGQYDWQGRLVSFVMRLAQIFFRSILLVFWIIFSVIIFLFWLVLPAFIIFQIILNLGFVHPLLLNFLS